MEVAKIVPQFFYDVIARGVPGGAMLAATSFALGDKVSIQSVVMYGFGGEIKDVSSTIFFLILVSLYSYVLGHIIEPIGDWISKSKIVNRLFYPELHVLSDSVDSAKSRFPERVRQCLEKEIGMSDGDKNELAINGGRIEYASILFIWSDWLRLKSADVGARIVKLRAEYRMLIGLCVVGLYAVILHLANVLYFRYVSVEEPAEINFVLVAGGLIVSLLGLKGYCKGYSTFQYSVINNYYSEREIERQSCNKP